MIIISTSQNRLDIILKEFLGEQLSRVEIQELIKNKSVLVDGNAVNKPSFSVKVGNKIEILDNKIEELKHKKQIPEHLEPLDFEVPIIYENENLLVIDKPASLTTHPGAGNCKNTLVNALLSKFKENELSNVRGCERLGIVHRLDKDTSGLMIVAKTNKAHKILAERIKSHTIDRYYVLAVHGVLQPSNGTIENHICRDRKNIERMRICEHDDIGAKLAITHYKTLKILNDGEFSIVECKLETGRTHQIRLHMYSQKHPIFGEKIYTFSTFKNDKYPHQMLRSYKLDFDEPITGEHLHFELQYDFEEVIKNTKKS